jgi:CSLREA domain-containing protein
MHALARLGCALSCALAFLIAISAPQRASAATFTVNSLGDAADITPGDGACADPAGACTLRAAIQEANSLPGDDAITFSVTGTINLTGALAPLTTNVAISGPGSGLLTLRRDTGGDYRIFFVNGASVGISGLTVTNGKTPDGADAFFGGAGGDGGGILNSGVLTLTDVVVTGNHTGAGGAGPALSGQGGDGGKGGNGGGIYNTGTLIMTGCNVSGNVTGRGGDSGNFAGDGGDGGGVFNSNILSMTDSVVSSNSTGRAGDSGTGGLGGMGGGIYSEVGPLALSGIIVSNNVTGDSGSSNYAAGNGGGIFVSSGSARLRNSTLSGNSTGRNISGNHGFGGGIENRGELTVAGSTLADNKGNSAGGILNRNKATVTNSTISGNAWSTEFSNNGGINNNNPTSTLTLINCTITKNSFGVLNFSSTPPVVANTIIAGNSNGPFASDAGGSFNSQGHNLIGALDPSSSSFNAAGDQSGSPSAPLNPLLAPLADYGGKTQTHLLLPGSPAINAGSNALLPADTLDLDNDGDAAETLPVDQRGTGFPRIVNTTVDIGAVEVNYAFSATSGTSQSATINTTFVIQLQATLMESGTPRSGVFVTFTAPSTGASGTFAGGNTTATVLTDTNGVATAPVFKADGSAGSYDVVANVGTGAPSTTFSLTNLKRLAQVNLSDLVQTYDGTQKRASITTSPSGLNIVVTYNGSTTPPTNAGSYAIVATVDDTSYNGQGTGTLTINKGSQTINFGALVNKTYGDPPFTVSATASSGLAVSFQIVSGPATISGNTITIAGAGSVTVGASQAGDANHNAAPSVEHIFTVNKAQATVMLSNLSYSYDGMPKTASVGTTPVGLPVSVAYTQNGQPVNAPVTVGSYSVTATVTDPNYEGSATGTLVIAKATTSATITSSVNPSEFGQPVTFTANVTSGAGTPAGTVQFRDGNASLGGPVALNNGTASVAISDLSPSAHAITVVFGGDANFDASTSATLTQIVNQQVSLSINNVSVTEGDAGTARADFAVTLSAASSQPIAVKYQTADGTANAGTDYAATSGTLTFAPGETTKTITVAVNGDVQPEPDETFFADLFSPTNTAIVKGQGTGTIVDDDAAKVPMIQFDSAHYSVGEGDLRATVTVTRSGDTSMAASVDYATFDNPAAVRCDDTATLPGVSFARCDYATTVGTLTFAAGDAQPKQITIPVIDDAHVEGAEAFQVRLFNPSGTSLGATSTTSITILDNDAFVQPNPILQTPLFVRMQYLDFLSREPEAGEPWSATLNNCASNDTSCDRISVSANFFRSQEFQLKGLFIFRFYKLAFNRMPLYLEIVVDMSSVTGSTTAELIVKKAAYATAFAQRQEFKNLYDGMTIQQFVDTLMGRYNLQQITTINPASPDDTMAARVTLTRSDLVSRLTAGTMTRGQVVRAIADSNEVGVAEFNPAFVAMQYFGYLRRDPEASGYNAWLQTINANPADFRSMVNGFMNSQEYRLRFGQP